MSLWDIPPRVHHTAYGRACWLVQLVDGVWTFHTEGIDGECLARLVEPHGRWSTTDTGETVLVTREDLERWNKE